MVRAYLIECVSFIIIYVTIEKTFGLKFLSFARLRIGWMLIVGIDRGIVDTRSRCIGVKDKCHVLAEDEIYGLMLV